MAQFAIVVQKIVTENYMLEASCAQEAVGLLEHSTPQETIEKETSIELITAQNV